MPEFHFSQTQPNKMLSPYVDSIFHAQGTIEYEFDTILPHGRVVLIVVLGKPHRVGKHKLCNNNPLFKLGWVSGIQSTPIYNYPMASTHVVGCLFKPVGFYQLFGQPMTAIANKSVALESVLGETTAGLIDVLNNVSDETELFRVLQSWITKRINSATMIPIWLVQGIATMEAADGQLQLDALYDGLQVSGRHFTTKFKQTIGCTPKMYCRILRMNRALVELDPGNKDQLIDIAYGAGYSDQAHFNKDFKYFSGLSPRDYFAHRALGFKEVIAGKDPLFVPKGSTS